MRGMRGMRGMRTSGSASCGSVPNTYSACLMEVLNGQKRVTDYVQGEKQRRWRFGSTPWSAMPRSGQPYQKVVSVALPAAEGVETLLLSYRIPYGYEGVLVTVTCLFTGTGFSEGSGDITWRVRNNFRFYKDLGAIEISLGDLEFPYPLEGGGYQVWSNDLIRFYTVLGAGALGRLAPDGRIVVGITGWIYPNSLSYQS